MNAYELVLRESSGVGRRYRVTPDGLLIGRGADNDICLADGKVSRTHARVYIEGDGLYVRDLESRNGIAVDGTVVEHAQLNDGNVLYIGDAALEVTVFSDSQVGQRVISYDEGTELYQGLIAKAGDERLKLVYRAAQLLGTVFDVDNLLDRILQLMFDALPNVQRGFVLLAPQPGREAEVCASRVRGSHGASSGPPLSHTLVDAVLREKQAVLTIDAQADSRFDAAMSVVNHKIHAAMCAPLCGRETVAGALYVDAGETEATFEQEDLELLMTLTRVVGVAVENARLYEERVERERLAAIGQATAGVGHCIKNIVTGIRGASEYIDQALQQRELRYLEKAWPIMGRAIQRIDMLVINLLTFSRERAMEVGPADVHGLVREVLEVVRGRADRYNITLEHVSDGNARAEMDAQAMYRVLLNLVTNALDACEEKGGQVTVSTRIDERVCSIEVRDTGPGIPPEVMPKLAQAFVSTKGSAGTGLGLACSYKIVREHGGDIVADSKPGQGAVFNVMLPRQTIQPTGGISTAQIRIGS